MVEYGLLIALVALIVLCAGAVLGSELQQWLWTLAGRLPIR